MKYITVLYEMPQGHYEAATVKVLRPDKDPFDLDQCDMEVIESCGHRHHRTSKSLDRCGVRQHRKTIKLRESEGE